MTANAEEAEPVDADPGVLWGLGHFFWKWQIIAACIFVSVHVTIVLTQGRNVVYP